MRSEPKNWPIKWGGGGGGGNNILNSADGMVRNYDLVYANSHSCM